MYSWKDSEEQVVGYFSAVEKPGEAPDVRLGPQGEASQSLLITVLLGGVGPHSVCPLESPLMSGAIE